jgi:hypothetical protein
MPELPGTTVDAAADRRYPRPAAAIVRKRVDKDNTVAIKHRSWQIDKTRFRNTLAGHFFFEEVFSGATVAEKRGRPGWLLVTRKGRGARFLVRTSSLCK